MEANNGQKSLLETEVYKDPAVTLVNSLKEYGLNEKQQEEIVEYISRFYDFDNNEVRGDLDITDTSHQEAMKVILDKYLDKERVTEEKYNDKRVAGLLFNLHRFLTGYRGYDPSAENSSDVINKKVPERGFFHEGFEIPEEGVIIIDNFVTKDLPKIVRVLDDRGIDLGRIRVRVPMPLLAAQLMMMDEDKRRDFEETVSMLDSKQFMLPGGISDPHEMNLHREKVALLYSPRTLPINPRFETNQPKDRLCEASTVTKIKEILMQQIEACVPGGRIIINVTVPEKDKKDQYPQFAKTEMVEGKKRTLLKITQQITDRVLKVMLGTLRNAGFERIHEGKQEPIPEYDHTKPVEAIHVVKVA